MCKTFDFLILKLLNFLIEYILYSYIFHIQRTSVKQLKKKNEIQTIFSNMFKRQRETIYSIKNTKPPPFRLPYSAQPFCICSKPFAGFV